MDLRLLRLMGWVILLVCESFVWTFDLLALWIAALLTWLLSYMLDIQMTQRTYSSFIFLFSAIAAILATRLLVLPKVKGKWAKEPMSAEAILWTRHTIQQVNNKLVIRYEWIYWNIESHDEIGIWDTVVVQSIKWNHLVVKK